MKKNKKKRFFLDLSHSGLGEARALKMDTFHADLATTTVCIDLIKICLIVLAESDELAKTGFSVTLSDL